MKVRSNLSIDEQVELQLRASPKRLVGSWWVVSGTLRKVVHLTKKRVIMVMASNIEAEPLKIPLHQLFTDECIFLGYGFIRPHQFVTDVRNGWMFRTDRYDPETIWLDLVSSNATSTLLQQSSYDLPGVYWVRIMDFVQFFRTVPNQLDGVNQWENIRAAYADRLGNLDQLYSQDRDATTSQRTVTYYAYSIPIQVSPPLTSVPTPATPTEPASELVRPTFADHLLGTESAWLVPHQDGSNP